MGRKIIPAIAFAVTALWAVNVGAEEKNLTVAVGLEIPLIERLSNGGSSTGIILADFLHVGFPIQGSIELADRIRAFAELSTVYRLKDTDLGFFEGFRLVPGLIYSLDEKLYARGGLLVRNDRVEFGGFSADDTSIGLDVRIGYRNRLNEKSNMIIEAGLPFTFTGDVKELPTIVGRGGLEIKL